MDATRSQRRHRRQFGRAGVLALLLLAGSGRAAAAQAGGLWPPGSKLQQALAPDCPTCWVQQATARPAEGAPVATPANPTCYGGPSVDFFRTALLVTAPRTPPAASGDLAEAIRRLDPRMTGAISEGSGADFRTLLRLPAGRVPYANCAPVAVLLPAGASVAATAIDVLAGQAVRHCDSVSGVCGDGGRLAQSPVRIAAGTRPAVVAVLFDGALAHGSAALLSVAFRMAGEAAPQPLD